jgi:hypothetical protein
VFLAATTRACQHYRYHVRKRRRSTRGAAPKRAASSLPMSRLCSASMVEHRAAKHSNSASNFLLLFPSLNFWSRHLSSSPARTQLVSTKHGVIRLRTSRLFLVRAPKNHIISISSSSNSCAAQHYRSENPTTGALRHGK